MANSKFPPTGLQLTFFRCGGICLGTAIHHTAVDGLGYLHFINSWARITHTDTHIPILPSVNRTILRARSPPSITSTQIDIDCYTTQSTPTSTNPPFTSAILKLSKHHLYLLKTTPNKNNPKPPLSTFKAVVSHIWRSACKARRLDPSCLTRIYITADSRTRLHPPLPDGYLGNAVFRTLAKATAGEVLSELGAVAKIDDAVKALDDEFIRSVVDYLEENVNDVGLRKDEWVMSQTDLWVVSWMGMPIYDADFGWGKPVYMGRACMKFGGLAYLLSSSPEEEEGGISVVMTMEEGKMGRFKEIFYKDIRSA